ncbi:biotin transporter BioY [Micrococcus sp.]|uniref:biotin transporter BioY n=1 Tax=Micrococcus sp. TaxID=1271 RepID=UPI002A90C6AF|nr:biotin transporter BioY [Micrococcus sp.]MDY6054976.1 biotin transporter BioY [Micrococcus sp.]
MSSASPQPAAGQPVGQPTPNGHASQDRAPRTPAPHDGDRRPVRGSSPGASLAKIAVMAAFMAVLGMAPPIPVAGIPAPIVLQNLAVILAGVILGPWRGAASMALFTGLVALGLPLLTGGRGGLGVFAGPSVGFILSFTVAAAVIGLIFWAMTGRVRPGTTAGRVFVAALVAGLVGSIVVVYLGGILGFVGVAGMTWGAAATSMLAFVPGDLTKVVLGALIAAGLWKAYPRAFR